MSKSSAKKTKQSRDDDNDPIIIDEEEEKSCGQIVYNKKRVKINYEPNDITKERIESLVGKLAYSNNLVDFFNSVKADFSYEKLKDVETHITLVKKKEIEYRKMVSSMINEEDLSGEIAANLKKFQSMSLEQIREKQKEFEIYRRELICLVEIGHTINPVREDYDTFIPAIKALKKSKDNEEEMSQSVFFDNGEDKTDSQLDEAYATEKNKRMVAKSKGLKRRNEERAMGDDSGDI